MRWMKQDIEDITQQVKYALSEESICDYSDLIDLLRNVDSLLEDIVPVLNVR